MEIKWLIISPYLGAFRNRDAGYQKEYSQREAAGKARHVLLPRPGRMGTRHEDTPIKPLSYQ
ncbi:MULTISPECIES: hypothetical protein [Rhizobium]|uniref:hypothetical protein n=1 Tax=Rhizobium TaxID=379 RepID=UPI00056FD417|nr:MULTISPECIES: hypothetical protein [Rhizobium]